LPCLRFNSSHVQFTRIKTAGRGAGEFEVSIPYRFNSHISKISFNAAKNRFSFTLNFFYLFKKWDLNAVVIGHVTSDGFLRVKKDGQVVVNIPADSLVVGGGAPVYQREAKEPEYLKEVRKFNPREIQQPRDLNDVFLKMLSSPNIASKEWVYEQYDTMVQTNTVVLPGGDAAVVRIKGTNKALALKTDCNSRYVYLNPSETEKSQTKGKWTTANGQNAHLEFPVKSSRFIVFCFLDLTN
jgi:hypothetical protein